MTKARLSNPYRTGEIGEVKQNDNMTTSTQRRILGVFAHPDDETSGAAGTFAHYARQGIEVYVLTATRGEQGTLGTGEMRVSRDDLPSVREAELRAVMELVGARPPILLDYRDQEVAQADGDKLVGQIVSVMQRLAPQVVITFGPMGISGHTDHIAIHQATVRAFHHYRTAAPHEPRLYYFALPASTAEQFGFSLDGPEIQPTVVIDVTAYLPLKIQAWRTYQSQEDAQRIAALFERTPVPFEAFHQAYPLADSGVSATGFWEDDVSRTT